MLSTDVTRRGLPPGTEPYLILATGRGSRVGLRSTSAAEIVGFMDFMEPFCDDVSSVPGGVELRGQSFPILDLRDCAERGNPLCDRESCIVLLRPLRSDWPPLVGLIVASIRA